MLAVSLWLPWPICVYLLMSGVTCALYLADKRRATRGAWRVRERTLHLCELFGGWPGALIAQQVFRHKRRKADYLAVFWGIVLLHLLAWAWWLRWLRL